MATTSFAAAPAGYAMPPAPVAARVGARAAVLTSESGSPAEMVNRAIESVRTASPCDAFGPRTRAGEVIEGKADLAYELSLDLMPDFEPADPAGLELKRPVYEAAEAEVDEALAERGKQNRTFEHLGIWFMRRAMINGDR